MKWLPSADWRERHVLPDISYRVRVAFSSVTATDDVWRYLRATHPVEGGSVLYGGAFLHRVGPTDIDIVSAGEDALDSLEYSVNGVLGGALATASPSAKMYVTEEERRDTWFI